LLSSKPGEEFSTYSESLEVIHRKLVSTKVEEGILKHASMAVTVIPVSETLWQI